MLTLMGATEMVAGSIAERNFLHCHLRRLTDVVGGIETAPGHLPQRRWPCQLGRR